eukprot:TRINITY_DN28380_c0_g1_i1.p1 TRINITY_DN28380_c0_g1~~TRINITY_DN28380_c0_g1_i1.p1  ORF type:complete len:515 (-),score=135.51 TRINITY_DN28380_c0_g1_i1:149-1693(-)
MAAGGGGAAKKSDAQSGMSDSEFADAFEESISRRDYPAALQACKKRLKAKPDDVYALAMRETVEKFVDATNELELEEAAEDDEELPPSLEEQLEKAHEATGKAFEAMYAYLQEGENLWTMGEQAIGIFWDVGINAPPGARRDRLLEMSRTLTKALLERLQRTGRTGEPGLDGTTWLFEGLGELWWCHELDLPVEQWLLDGCREELICSDGCMKTLVGYSKAKLPDVPLADLCDVLTQVWTLERSVVCGLLAEDNAAGAAGLPALEYGVKEVLAEIQSRPLIEPPLDGFYGDFYLITHVVYTLNCFNGCLPSRRADAPWMYAYLERSLAFWLREARACKSAKASVAKFQSLAWGSEAVDAVSEAVDNLLGLGEDDAMYDGDLVREGIAWLLSRQDEDGFFYSPGARKGPEIAEYDQLHPTWTAVAALQLDRKVPPDSSKSQRCLAWTRHCRAAAEAVGFAQSPLPRAMPPAPSADVEDLASKAEAAKSPNKEAAVGSKPRRAPSVGRGSGGVFKT